MKEKRDERQDLKNKGLGKSSEANTIKLVLNSLVGKYKSNFSFLKDDLANLQVTLTGQLCLCILVERLWLMKFRVISLNTDGLVTIVPKNRVDLYKSIISDFEQEYGFEGEYNQYKWYIRKDVNNYIAKQIDGKFKYKGIFDYKIYLEKGYKYPIINYVLKEYYENEQTKSVKDIILSNIDIYDFCVCQKAKKTFTMYYGDVAIQSSTRAYVSLNGKPIVKKQPVVSKKTGETRISTTTLLKNKVFTLFNDYFEVDNFEDYQIDYDYYIGECQKIIDKITKNYNNGR